jgi:hypothetical protein
VAIKVYEELVQGTDEWLQARCGLLTASSISKILTAKTLKFAENDTCRDYLRELAAQRIMQYVDPGYVSDDMQRGHDDEFFARFAYSEHFTGVHQVGFITNDELGFPIGYSPDGLIDDDGLLEIKSRKPKHQLDIILDGSIPFDHRCQAQTGLLVSGREWLDYLSYCGGMHCKIIRVTPDENLQSAIVLATDKAEAEIVRMVNEHEMLVKLMQPAIMTVRRWTEII